MNVAAQLIGGVLEQAPARVACLRLSARLVGFLVFLLLQQGPPLLEERARVGIARRVRRLGLRRRWIGELVHPLVPLNFVQKLIGRLFVGSEGDIHFLGLDGEKLRLVQIVRLQEQEAVLDDLPGHHFIDLALRGGLLLLRRGSGTSAERPNSHELRRRARFVRIAGRGLGILWRDLEWGRLQLFRLGRLDVAAQLGGGIIPRLQPGRQQGACLVRLIRQRFRRRQIARLQRGAPLSQQRLVIGLALLRWRGIHLRLQSAVQLGHVLALRRAEILIGVERLEQIAHVLRAALLERVLGKANLRAAVLPAF